MRKVLVIVGPTAIGKSGFGVELARRYNGEIISGDSVQVYRGFDIGSGKITPEEAKGIKHYLIDTKDFNEDYNVAEFQKEARRLIEDIASRDKLAIIVGGTGLYIKATLYDYVFNEEDIEDDDFKELSNEEIYAKLKELDPECLEKIHVNNRKRLVRALNVCLKTNEKMSDNIKAQSHKMLYDAKIIGLTTNREEVYARIDKRVRMMIDDGLENEIRTLLNKGVKFSDKPMTSIGYKQFEEYIIGKQDLERTIELIQRDTRRFAKRQYTWFNHQTPIEWYDIHHLEEAIVAIDRWLHE